MHLFWQGHARCHRRFQLKDQAGWANNSSNETSFSVERSWDGVFFSPVASLPASTTSYDFNGAHYGVTYHFRVQAIASTLGGSPYSNKVSSAPKAFSTLIAAPTKLTARRTGSTNTLTWADNSGIETGYRIEGSSDSIRFQEIAIVPANTVTTAPPGFYSVYRVQAIGSGGDSRYSNLANLEWPATFAVPINASATAISATQIDLVWTDGGTSESFRLERSIDNANFLPLARVRNPELRPGARPSA